MYKFVLFDMDGTILNTIENIQDCVNYTLRKFSYPEIDLEQTKHYTGYASRHLITKSCPEGVDIEEPLAFFCKYYKENCNVNVRPFDGIIELVEKLKAQGIKTAVVTNKADDAAKALTDSHFPGAFDSTVGVQEGYAKKPEPDLVYKAMEELGADPLSTVYIGDTEVDINTAKNANIPCIAVTWGFRDLDEIIDLGANVYCDTAEEVYKAIIEG